MTQVVFQGIDSIQLMTQARKTDDSESIHDSNPNCMRAGNWFDRICTQMALSVLNPFEWRIVLLE